MTRTVSLAALAGTTFAIVLTSAAPSAVAATVKTLPKQTLSATSVNGYRATIAPKYTLPRGTVKVSASVTVSRGGTVKARGVTSYRAAAGMYSATSAVTYRSRTVYSAYKTHSGTANAESCKVTSAIVDVDTSQGGWYVPYTTSYTGTCTGTAYDSNFESSHTGTFIGHWTGSDYTSRDNATTVRPVDDVGSTAEWPDASVTFTWKTKYTAYRYGSVRSLSTRRTVAVIKVANSPVMSRSEFNAVRKGDSLSRVRAIVGSRGSMAYTDRDVLGTAYRWTNTSGGTTWVWFLHGRVTSYFWYTF